MSQLSNDDLLKIITFDASDYREETISIAKEELKRRGIETVDEEKLKELKSVSDLSNIPVKWLTFYTYFLLPIGVLRSIIEAFRALGKSAYFPYGDVVMFVTILLSIFIVAVIVGLHKRRLWGWKLNWVLLILNSLMAPFGMAQSIGYYLIFLALVSVVYFWPHYIYFRKRRRLFDLPEQEVAPLATNADN
jgi:lysylphosphatidylglycerol synthetase-like protein (DUF2156 family)